MACGSRGGNRARARWGFERAIASRSSAAGDSVVVKVEGETLARDLGPSRREIYDRVQALLERASG